MSQGDRILNLLRTGPKTSVQFTFYGILRYSARIHELRNKGHRINGRQLDGSNVWEYELA